MSKIKAVLFNGPPRSGKDTAAEWLTECLNHRISTRQFMPYNYKMAESLKLAAHALFGEETLHANAFEECKDEPNSVFLGRTPRQVYIALSEKFAKPQYGDDFLGRVFINRIMQKIKADMSSSILNAMIICSDLGFNGEAETLAKEIGAENILIVHLHRRGCDFSNDSRSYLRLPGAEMCSITNDNITAFRMEVYSRVGYWLDGKQPTDLHT